MAVQQKVFAVQLFDHKRLQSKRRLPKIISLVGLIILFEMNLSCLMGQNLVGTATGDVTTYGALGDGNQDNTTYLQDAIDDTPPGGVLIIPNGNYVCTGTLTISYPITIIGQGFQKTVLNFVNSDGIEIETSDVKFQDIRIYNTVTNSVKYTGVNVDSGSRIDNFKLENVDISNFSTALKINQLWNFDFSGLSLSQVGDIGIHSTGLSVNNHINNMRITAKEYNALNSKGIFFDGTSSASEGWSINNALIYGFEILIKAQRMCHVNLSNSILDFAGKRGIVLESVGDNLSAGWIVTNNYIAVMDDGIVAIHDGNTASGVNGGNIFSNNLILSYGTCLYGILCDNNSDGDIITGNRIRGAEVHDIKANSNDKFIITNNNCLSNITYNIYAKGLIANNIGTVYFQEATNYCMIGKIKCSYASVLPTTGSWNAGDIVWKVNPFESGNAGSKYILHGWRRLTTGTANVLNTDWAEMRMLTGN